MTSINGVFGSTGRHGMLLKFEHVPTGFTVEFPAFLDLFSDQYSSHWNEEQVFGRMDPIATFSHTRRNLSFAWHVPADSFEDAQRNLSKMNKLISFLYPLYDKKAKGGATAMNMGPLLRVKFGNLIQSANGGGLLGYVNGFTFDPELQYGMFHKKPTLSTSAGAPKKKVSSTDIEYYPKTFRVNCELNVLHEHALGFSENPKPGTKFSLRSDELKGGNAFPYEVGNPPPSQKTLKGRWDTADKEIATIARNAALKGAATLKAAKVKNPTSSNNRITAAVNQTILFPSKDEK